ncbi:hypothetical protein E2C01_086815 [Portunus trituberculatus]|uniref:Uncharacterized protein n=1 Tax=Portunus trituberculatus TaxID=210409 RepID=A0A5B7JFN4_PORTR|nr:hypothetical protein [Portunus trituberculatus]
MDNRKNTLKIALLSHHEYFPRPLRLLAEFSRVFLQLIM